MTMKGFEVQRFDFLSALLLCSFKVKSSLTITATAAAANCHIIFRFAVGSQLRDREWYKNVIIHRKGMS